MFTLNSKINDVINDTDFGNYGRLIFPVDMNIDNNLELKDAASILPWYSEVNPEKTVEIVNYMKEKASNGERIFYDIYTEEEKRNDAANGKSEKEITRMVIDRLQKKNNAKQKSKNKPIFTDRTQMENFLKLS